MLNRRILRMKLFKAVYCYAENQGMTLKEVEALMETSCEAARDLYLFLLSLVGPLTAEARSRIEAARSKFRPTEEELNPNLRFVENGITPLLTQDPDFTKIISKKKFSWEQYDVFLRHLYERIRDRKYFKEYMEKEESGLEDDARLWSRIYERELEDDPELEDILEDMSIYWNDDLGYAASWCRKTMASLAAGERWSLPPLYRSDAADGRGLGSDKLFVYKILRAAYTNFAAYSDRIAELTPKWNRDRICTTDLALIVCGMAESEAHPGTSAKIIINEYVEIAKGYSTPESSSFVNGLLDKLINKHE